MMPSAWFTLLSSMGDRKRTSSKVCMSFSRRCEKRCRTATSALAAMWECWPNRSSRSFGRRCVVFPQRGDVFPDQLAGSGVPNLAEFAAREQSYVKDAADWDAYRLTQLTAKDSPSRSAPTSKGSGCMPPDGKRSLGMAFLGDVTGGVAVSVKKFCGRSTPPRSRFKAPGRLGRDPGVVLVAPSPAMEPAPLRHHRPRAEMATKTGSQVGRTAGARHTSELTLWPLAASPPTPSFVAMAKTAAEPACLVAAPEYYHA